MDRYDAYAGCVGGGPALKGLHSLGMNVFFLWLS